MAAARMSRLGFNSISSALVIFASLFLVAEGITLQSVEVPRYQTVDSRARLVCNYDLGSDKLYSVKWYKDGNEFYRYVPRDSPPSQVFTVANVNVDQRQSSDREVILTDLRLGSAGLYMCEASSEAPRFKTVSKSSELQMVDLPDSRPVLSGGEAKGYRVGDLLDVNCSSPNSAPPAQLKWYINSEMVDSDYLMREPPLKDPSTGLYTASLRLKFRLKRSHFVQGHVTVKCTATLYAEYFESSQLYLPGLGLGEKALPSRTNGAGIHLISSTVALLLLLLLVITSA